MQNLNSKFEYLVRRLGYKFVSLGSTATPRIQDYILRHWPDVVEELKQCNWDLEKDSTWEETAFLRHTMNWYEKRVGVYLTDSIRVFELATKVVYYPSFKAMRKHLGLDAQVVVLCNQVPFIKAETLDDIYISIDFESGVGCIDCSGYSPDEEATDEEYLWLNSAISDEGEYVDIEEFHKLWIDMRRGHFEEF